SLPQAVRVAARRIVQAGRGILHRDSRGGRTVRRARGCLGAAPGLRDAAEVVLSHGHPSTLPALLRPGTVSHRLAAHTARESKLGGWHTILRRDACAALHDRWGRTFR